MKIKVFFFLLIFIPLKSEALDLSDLYFSALEHDPELQVAIKEQEAGQQNELINRSYLLPNVSYGYSQFHNNQTLTYVQSAHSSSTNLEYTSKVNQLTLNQTVFNLAQYENYKKGVFQTALANETFKAKALSLVKRLAETYFDLLYAEDQISLLNAQQQTLNEQFKVNQKLIELREGTKTDLLETKARLEILKVQLLDANNKLSSYLNSLKSMTGIDLKKLASVEQASNKNFAFFKQLEFSYEELESVAMQRSSDVLLAEKVVDIAFQDLKIKKAGNYPTVNLQAVYGETESQFISQYNQRYLGGSVGVQVNVPIYAGGFNTASIHQANAVYEMALADLNLKKEKLHIDLFNQYNLLNSLNQQVLALTTASDSASLLIEANRKSILSGVRVNLDLLNSEQQFYQVCRDLSKAKYDYSSAYIQLKVLAGIFTAEDLIEVSKNFY